MPNEETLIISSDPRNVELLEPFLEEFSKQCEMGKDDFNDVLLVLTEAVNNCIIHGNNKNPDKFVYITANKSECRLSFCVADEGQGFDFHSLPDCTSDERLNLPNGRGVFLIKAIAHRVHYQNNGSRVLIHFNF